LSKTIAISGVKGMYAPWKHEELALASGAALPLSNKL